VAKFGAIPDLFEGGPSSTQNYRAKSRGNSINLEKSTKRIPKNLKLGGCFTKGIWSMTRLAWLRRVGRQFFFNKYNFFEKLAWEILEKIRKNIRLKLSCSPSFLALTLFAREPQILMMKPSSSAPPVSRGRGSPPSDVATGYGIK
jgi:hypothetical protein